MLLWWLLLDFDLLVAAVVVRGDGWWVLMEVFATRLHYHGLYLFDAFLRNFLPLIEVEIAMIILQEALHSLRFRRFWGSTSLIFIFIILIASLHIFRDQESELDGWASETLGLQLVTKFILDAIPVLGGVLRDFNRYLDAYWLKRIDLADIYLLRHAEFVLAPRENKVSVVRPFQISIVDKHKFLLNCLSWRHLEIIVIFEPFNPETQHLVHLVRWDARIVWNAERPLTTIHSVGLQKKSLFCQEYRLCFDLPAMAFRCHNFTTPSRHWNLLHYWTDAPLFHWLEAIQRCP